MIRKPAILRWSLMLFAMAPACVAIAQMNSTAAPPEPRARDLGSSIIPLIVEVANGHLTDLPQPKALVPPKNSPAPSFVKTKEQSISTSEGDYMQISFDDVDYFVKTRRAGSSYTEVRCLRPLSVKIMTAAKVARRSDGFVRMLRAGCAATEQKGFLFEQKLNASIWPDSSGALPAEADARNAAAVSALSSTMYTIFTLLGSPIWTRF